MEQVLDDIRLLQQHENGVATCLRTIKKFVLPKIYQTLFPLYLACVCITIHVHSFIAWVRIRKVI